MGPPAVRGGKIPGILALFKGREACSSSPRTFLQKKGHELVVGGESLPRPGVQSGHWLLQGGRCLMSFVPQVSSTLTVTEAGVGGLPLERAEQKRSVLRVAPWAALQSKVLAGRSRKVHMTQLPTDAGSLSPSAAQQVLVTSD